MAKLRERNEQIEIILERRHVILLGFCAIVLGSLLFLLGMLTQRTWLSTPSTLVAAARKETPPPLFPDRSAEPNVRKEDFEFYEKLTGTPAKDAKPSRTHDAELTAHASASTAPASTAAAKTSQPAPPVAAQASAKSPDKSASVAQASTAKSAPPTVEVAAKTTQSAKSDSHSAKTSSSTHVEPAVKVTKNLPSTDKSGAYALQVVALADRSDAQAYSKRLKSKGYPAFVDSARVNGKVVFRVKVGNYGSRDKAKQVASKLEAEVGRGVLVQRAAEG
jgi:cell division septation protein DedD